mgnify:CR=1 FL=1|jgi:hypothetical protein
MPSPTHIVIFCGQDWWYHNRAHSDFQLMTRAAKHRKVLLVNSIGMRMPTPGKSPMPLRRLWRKLNSMLRKASQPLPETPDYTVMTPILFPFYGSAKARAFNSWFIRFQVARQARKLGIVDPHIIVTVPTAWDVAKKMRRSSLVYNRSDKHSAFSEVDNSLIVGLERELMAHSDAVLYCSHALMESEKEFTAERGLFMDHGVDTQHFAKRPPTGALTSLGHPRPIIGFFGGLEHYVVDFDLLERIAKERPHYSLVLIGDATLSMERFSPYPNVHLLGFQKYETIPVFGADFDISIMPYRDNEWTRWINPIKLKEYLLLGHEVVAAFFGEAPYYTDYIHLAHNHDEFLAHLDAVLAGKKAPGDRHALLAKASWDDRTLDLIATLDGIAAAKKGKPQPCAAS